MKNYIIITNKGINKLVASLLDERAGALLQVKNAFFLTIFPIISLLLLYPKCFAALQSEQLISETFQIHKNCIIKEAFGSDFTCTENSITSETQIDKYYKPKPNQLEVLLRQTIEECSHRDGSTLIKFLILPHPIYFEMTNKGNGHLYLPISQKEYKAFKVYDSHDDNYLFMPSQAKIQIKDVNQDGLYDFDIQFNVKHLHGKTSFVHRIFIQNFNGFFYEI